MPNKILNNPNMKPYRIKSISEYHKILCIEGPQHPLVSVVDLRKVKPYQGREKVSVIFDFYIVSLKRTENGTVKYTYGQQQYDFDEGILFFIAPNQVFSFEPDEDFSSRGFVLLLHPDFLWGTPMANKIKEFDFFSYSVNEALFVSENEESTLKGFIQNIEKEYKSTIDKFSQGIIISQIEAFLTYSDRFYQRQFLTRKISNLRILERLEEMLENYFAKNIQLEMGLPKVHYVADELNISPNYLSGVLRTLTGQNTKQHIQDKVIELAKLKLSTTDMTISEIAFDLGFEYSQSFSKLFRKKTKLSPLEFRTSFN